MNAHDLYDVIDKERNQLTKMMRSGFIYVDRLFDSYIENTYGNRALRIYHGTLDAFPPEKRMKEFLHGLYNKRALKDLYAIEEIRETNHYVCLYRHATVRLIKSQDHFEGLMEHVYDGRSEGHGSF